MKVGSRTTDEAYDKAYEHRKISVAVTRKKKTAIDAMSNVVEATSSLDGIAEKLIMDAIHGFGQPQNYYFSCS